uniref:Uncharacterized protein n=1 Tax=Romanomermis culicivorax TaxID=13658 RepID=A0A915L2V5_ROMCU
MKIIFKGFNRLIKSTLRKAKFLINHTALIRLVHSYCTSIIIIKTFVCLGTALKKVNRTISQIYQKSWLKKLFHGTS